ncbi:hypothetical protein T09_446 [Trichinella sp. T9]|nr:hypothetical protein T09_446 [Trichinella sp. T9]
MGGSHRRGRFRSVRNILPPDGELVLPSLRRAGSSTISLATGLLRSGAVPRKSSATSPRGHRTRGTLSSRRTAPPGHKTLKGLQHAYRRHFRDELQVDCSEDHALPPSVRPHLAHREKGGARQAKTHPGEAVSADPPLVVPPEESARISIFLPHADLQVHLLDVGLQSDAEAVEAEDSSQQIDLEVSSRLQLAVQRGSVVYGSCIEHDPALSLVAGSLVDLMMRKIPRPPQWTGCRRWFRPFFVEVLPHDRGVLRAIFLAFRRLSIDRWFDSGTEYQNGNDETRSPERDQPYLIVQLLINLRTRTELTTLFLQTTKQKKGEATVRRIGLEDRRWSTVVRTYVGKVVVALSEKLAITHRRRFLLAFANRKYTYCLLFDCHMPSGKRESERKGNPPVNTDPSPNMDERANNTVEEVNEPARGSGSLHWEPVQELTPSVYRGAYYCPPPAFRPEMDSVEWLERLEDFLCISRVPPPDHGVVARYLLSDPVRRELYPTGQERRTPSRSSRSDCWAQSTGQLIERFQALHQREGQTIEQYAQEVAEIRCRAGVSERDLLARFAWGITSKEAYLAIRLQEPATLTEARRLVSKVMRAEEDFHQRRQSHTGNPKPEKTEATQSIDDLIREVKKVSMKLEKQEPTAVRHAARRHGCFNCGGLGHLRRDSPPESHAAPRRNQRPPTGTQSGFPGNLWPDCKQAKRHV